MTRPTPSLARSSQVQMPDGEMAMGNFSGLMLALLVTAQVTCNAAVPAAPSVSKTRTDASTLNVSQYVTQQGWSLVKSTAPTLPVNDIAPLVYTAKGDFSPSCGLLAHTAAGTEFFEMLTPERGAGFPQCLAVNDVASFKMRDRQYLVFEYINRDTKEDFYRQYFYLYRGPAGRYIADKESNNSAVWTEPVRASPNSISSPRATEGVRRARGILLSTAVPGMQFLEREFMVGKTSTFAAFQDKSKEKCTFLVDAGDKPIIFQHEVFSNGDKCQTVLAAGQMDHAGATYYLALFKGDSRNHLGVVSVGPNNIVATESRGAIAAAKKSTLPDLKTAKEALKLAL